MTLLSNSDMAALAREMEKDRRLAEHYLLCYADEAERYFAQREEHVMKGGEASLFRGENPTQRAAVRGIEFDNRSGEVRVWLQAVEAVERGLGEKKKYFLEARRRAEKLKGNGFKQGRPGWVRQTQRIYAELMPAARHWLADRTVKSWWHEMVGETVGMKLKIKNLLGQHFIP